MPTLQIRDLPQELYEELKATAEQNRRSMTQEAIHILDKFMSAKNEQNAATARKKAALERLKTLHPYFAGINTHDIVAMIREDRDR